MCLIQVADDVLGTWERLGADDHVAVCEAAGTYGLRSVIWALCGADDVQSATVADFKKAYTMVRPT